MMEGAPRLAPFNPSSKDVIGKTAGLLQLDENDVLFDLGCGDARLLCELAKCFRCRCIGVEYDKEFVERALTEVKCTGTAEFVEIRHADATKVEDLVQATAIFMYLSLHENNDLRDLIQIAFQRGVKIVSNMFRLSYLGEPAKVEECDGITRLFLYHKMSNESEQTGKTHRADEQEREEGKGEEEEESDLLKKLQWFFDPLKNPYIIQVFNGSMIALFLLNLILLYFGLGNIHVYIITTLCMLLAIALNWFMKEFRAAVEQEEAMKRQEQKEHGFEAENFKKPSELRKER